MTSSNNSFPEGTPTAEIQLAGRSYTLGFTIGAIKRTRDLGVMTIDVSDGTALMLALPQYVWCCLGEADRNELSVKAIDELMNPHNVEAIATAVAELFKTSMPDPPEKNASPAAVMKTMQELTAGAKASTSTDSGPSPSTPLA